MFPSHAKLFLAPYSDTDYFSSYVNYWDDVYGVNMSCIRPKAVQWMIAEPYVENTEPKAVAMAKPIVILVKAAAHTRSNTVIAASTLCFFLWQVKSCRMRSRV